ncbi:hypothetical protein [Salininema proteolyticum]|uniref:Head-to-tail adaptor n=1 Tax=Salininema proteolyticum TaxID=1607685 RepID=A0ABV8U041_9ACTN
MAQAALDEASALAREYGHAAWEPGTVPPLAANLVARAVARYLRNPADYSRSRSGDEVVEWAGEAGGLDFTTEERRLLRSLSGRGVIASVPVIAWRSQPVEETGRVPVSGGEKPFPYYSGGGPW